MIRFDQGGGDLRQPEATSKSRLPHLWRYSANDLDGFEATEATFLEVSHVREKECWSSPDTEGVMERSPQLPHLIGNACVGSTRPEATSDRRLPQVASREAV